MAEPGPSKKQPAFRIVTNETGAITRVPIARGTATQRPLPPRIPAAAAPSRPAAAAPSRPAAADEEEIVIPVAADEEEIIIGEPAAAAAPSRPAVAADEEEIVIPTGDDEEEIVIPTAEEKEAEEDKKKLQSKKNLPEIQKQNDIGKMKLFYRYRAKNPTFFRYTKEGNLIVLPDNPVKVPPMTIPLRAFSALTSEELEELERKQEAEQKEVEQRYVKKLRELQAASMIVPEETMKVYKLNQEVRELSILRNNVAYPEMGTDIIENPEVRKILLKEEHEERKLGYDVYLFKRSHLSRHDALGHYRERTVGGPMKGGADQSTDVYFIRDSEDIFHPTKEREFVFNKTQYVSPYQAYQAERFKDLGDEEKVEKILGTRSAQTIKNLVAKETHDNENTQKLWEEILEAFYTQNKQASDDLQKTGSARFHLTNTDYADPIYTNALVTIRTRLKEKSSETPAYGGSFERSVITKEEQKKARVGAIIQNYRRG